MFKFWIKGNRLKYSGYRIEASRHVRSKKKEYLKAKIDERVTSLELI